MMNILSGKRKRRQPGFTLVALGARSAVLFAIPAVDGPMMYISILEAFLATFFFSFLLLYGIFVLDD